MRQAATQELYSYWNKLRGARLSPEREEIDPVEIRHILADTMILEVDDERQFPLRISGTRLSALFLDERKGHAFVGLFAPEDRDAASAMISGVVEGVRPVVAGLTAELCDDMPAHLELLLLPLRHHGKTHARVLGMLTPTAIPSWFGLRRTDHLRLVAMRFVGDEQAAALPIFAAYENDEDLQPSDLARRARTRRKSFFVIRGGRKN
ncbi:PAS domain-containing protein [Rhodoblastus acidophilus]|uniref:PAS domain-containing protein n=1 Tax=Candidatus Rhodoblastus alkanivorans TaxID=2954117 RepID=A0ABS9Z9B1_9HYPH|nr:PAS domain-containing protein [Candidatus Rhodoblastus alkanivorans]MCI4679990.1 PAS domain-containing protein [Candidatus Rhodoblastus alkanivorans]MCI4684268.1 PAS domain-containing protein [Candidatus Rhodoblastus alkanivorans]MDI4641588.1 PAS domain-containing protein [Rhodoblastus acidophilus]